MGLGAGANGWIISGGQDRAGQPTALLTPKKFNVFQNHTMDCIRALVGPRSYHTANNGLCLAHWAAVVDSQLSAAINNCSQLRRRWRLLVAAALLAADGCISDPPLDPPSVNNLQTRGATWTSAGHLLFKEND